MTKIKITQDACNYGQRRSRIEYIEVIEHDRILIVYSYSTNCISNLLQDANNRFVSEKHSSGAASQREQMLKELSQGYDAYIELSANLQEGTKVKIICSS